MQWIAQLYLNQFFVFTLVLARVSGLVMTAPVWGSAEVPRNVRALLAFALAVLVTPLQTAVYVDHPGNLLNYGVVIGGELLIGLMLGVGLQILMSGIQIAGQVIAQMSGLALADVVSPGFDDQIPLFSHLLHLVAVAVFVLIGGDRQVMDGLLGTFATIPLGQAGLPHSIGEMVMTLLTQSLSLGVRAAAPTMTALLLATLVLGLISRTLPQLNILAVGFGLNTLVTLGAMALSLQAMAWIFQEQVEPAIVTILSGLGPAG